MRTKDFIDGKVARWTPPCMLRSASKRKLDGLAGSLCGPPTDLRTDECAKRTMSALRSGEERFGKVRIFTCDAFIKSDALDIGDWIDWVLLLRHLGVPRILGKVRPVSSKILLYMTLWKVQAFELFVGDLFDAIHSQ